MFLTFFTKRKKQKPFQQDTLQLSRKDDFNDLSPAEYGFGEDFYAETQQPRQQPPSTPQQFQQPQPIQQPVVQPSLAPHSFTENTYEIILSKMDVIDAKLDSLSRRLEMVERLLQSLQQQPVSQESQYKGYARRNW